MTDKEKVLAKHPTAVVGLSCTKYSAWFEIILRGAKRKGFWQERPYLGSGDCEEDAWEDAARRIEQKEVK